MLKNININNHNLDIYILNDQPTTCGICAARTEFEDITDEIQLHQCLSPDCGYQFLAEKDEEIRDGTNEKHS